MQVKNSKNTMKFSSIVSNIKEIPLPTEKVSKRGFVSWGDDNLYPYYLNELYQGSSLFQAIVATELNYILGNEIVNDLHLKIVNKKFDTMDDFVYRLVRDKLLYGGFAFQIIRNRAGEIAELYNLDFRYVRVNEDEDLIYYNKNWENTRQQAKVYERFYLGEKKPNCVFYEKGRDTLGVYPVPMYVGAITSLEIHSQIGQYHLNNLLNNFADNTIINFNNGDGLSEDVMDEIQETIEEKFAGTKNAGRFFLSFNPDQEHKTTFEKVQSDATDTKYQQLYETTIEDILMGFRINKLLLGNASDNTGFNKASYLESFALYNKTVIEPIRRDVLSSLDMVFGKGVVTIKPFELDWSEEDTSKVIE